MVSRVASDGGHPLPQGHDIAEPRDRRYAGGESLNQLYARVDQAIRALTLLLGTWAIYSQIGVLTRIPFVTLRLFSPLPLLATVLLLRFTHRPIQLGESVPSNDHGGPSAREFPATIVSLGGALAAALLFFFTKSEWLYWIAAISVLGAEVWLAPASQRVIETPSADQGVRRETWILACLCLVAASATAGLMKPDIDDAYYVNVATSVIEFPEKPPQSFDALHHSDLPPVEETLHLPQTYEILVGLVSSVSGVAVPTLYYLVFPPLWAVLGTLAHWLVFRHLLPRREALLATVLWIFILLFLGDGIRTFGSFGFARLFQGKSVFLVVVVPVVVLSALRYRQRPGLATWVCLALSETAGSALTTNGIIIAPLAAALAIVPGPRFDWKYARMLAGGAAASLPVFVVAALMHQRLEPFLTAADPDPYFTPYVTTLGWRRAPLVLLALLALPALATRARLASANWIRSYVWLVVFLVFLPATSSLATLALGNNFSWRIFWCVPVPLLVAAAGAIAVGALLDRRWLPEGAIIGWLLVFAIAAPQTFAEGRWSVHNFGRLKVVQSPYSAAKATVALARTDAPALATEAVSMYLSGIPGRPPLIAVRRLYLRKLLHLIPDAELARRLELFGYVARGDRGSELGEDLEEITRALGGDPNLPFSAAMRGIDAGGIATVVFREDHPDLTKLIPSLVARGFMIHHESGFVVAALPKTTARTASH
jgi:uncharacterized protein DUF6077